MVLFLVTVKYCGALFGGKACVFHCLPWGSGLTPNTRSSADIRRRLAQASSAFDCLLEVLVDDKSFLATQRQLYNACVASVMFSRSECWTTLCSDLRH